MAGLHESLARVLVFQFCSLALTSINLIDRILFVIYQGRFFLDFFEQWLSLY